MMRAGSPSAPGPTPQQSLERELTILYRRWRGAATRLSCAVHPDLDAAGYGVLVFLDESGPLRSALITRYGSGAFLAILGLGIGMTMQNLVLAVQNTVAPAELGSTSSTVSFFRSRRGERCLRSRAR